ncbi:c-type cytochrome [Halomonas sp. HK25]|uniref:c-type cytochrome n=1 Tax=Halomonas sp. HK25 TaxID=3394321 RepID=UPI0039FCD937
MNSSKLIMGCLATLGLTAGLATAQANVDRDAIAERLKPAGQLCLQGEDCGTAAAAEAAPAANGGIDGGDIYNRVCMACHETGAAGAPVRSDEDAWAARLDQGWDTLLDHSINGFNAMPARGGNPNLSDDEVAAATAYLLEPVMDVPELGGAEEAPAEEAPAEEAPAEEEAPTEAAAEEDAVAEDEATAEAADDAATEEAADAAGPSHAGIDGEAIYNQACMACHMTGAAGAPIKGDADAWSARLEQGMETLYDHSINGFNAMPAKGGNMSLSDDDVKAAVDFMVEAVE